MASKLTAKEIKMNKITVFLVSLFLYSNALAESTYRLYDMGEKISGFEVMHSPELVFDRLESNNYLIFDRETMLKQGFEIDENSQGVVVTPLLNSSKDLNKIIKPVREKIIKFMGGKEVTIKPSTNKLLDIYDLGINRNGYDVVYSPGIKSKSDREVSFSIINRNIIIKNNLPISPESLGFIVLPENFGYNDPKEIDDFFGRIYQIYNLAGPINGGSGVEVPGNISVTRDAIDISVNFHPRCKPRNTNNEALITNKPCIKKGQVIN